MIIIIMQKRGKAGQDGDGDTYPSISPEYLFYACKQTRCRVHVCVPCILFYVYL